MEYAVGQMVAPGLVVISLDSALKLGELEKERDDLLLQISELKTALATIVGECANLNEAVVVANKALGEEGPK